MKEVSFVKISDIKPAPYNPRKISDEQAKVLQESFKKIGFVVPIIINKKNNIIIAGHQRSNNASKIGIDIVPAFYVDDISVGDEIRFNQMHNGVETKDLDGVTVDASKYKQEAFITIPCNEFNVDMKSLKMTLVKEICKLIVKYGNVMSAVICKNTVLFAREYVYACKLINEPVNCYICDDSKYDDILKYFCQDYGAYSYDNIERNTFVQGLAQLNRSVSRTDGKRLLASTLYVNKVIPYLSNHEVKSILDFGCGKGAYINALAKQYDAVGVEFYNNDRKHIDVKKGHTMIDNLIHHLEDKGKFDIVVCDSVLNSVDSVEAEKSVMTCLNLFAKDIVFISGRPRNRIDRLRNQQISTDSCNYVYYPDENGFTATYREGKWFFQKFHTKEQVEKIASENGFEIEEVVFDTNTFKCRLKKVRELSMQEYIDAVNFEFNLPLPNGKSYNRQDDIKKVLGLEL